MQNQIEFQFEPNKNILYLVYGLFALGLFAGYFPTIAGVVVAYVKRNEFMNTIYFSHFNYLIKTFWGGVIGFGIGIILSFVFIGFFILFLVGIWYFVRVVYAFVKVLDQKPVNDESWLI